MRNGLIGMMVVVFCLAAAAQVPAVVEVSSVKENRSQGPVAVSPQLSPAGLRFFKADLMMVLPWAHDIDVSFTETQIDWSRVNRALLLKTFDIDVRGTGDPKALTRLVFAQRFGLRTHTETRQMRLAALVVKAPGRLGPRLKPSSVNCRELLAAGAFKEPGSKLAHPQCNGISRYAGSIADLIRFQAPRYVGRPVVDRTDLRGNYEWQVSFKASGTPEELEAQRRNAFEDQLGLTFKDITGPYEVLVIDELHEPTPN